MLAGPPPRRRRRPAPVSTMPSIRPAPRTVATSGWPRPVMPGREPLAQRRRPARSRPSRSIGVEDGEGGGAGHRVAAERACRAGRAPAATPRRRTPGRRRSAGRRRAPWPGSGRRARRPSVWCANQAPVRPMPVCTSSRTSSAPCCAGDLRGPPPGSRPAAGRRRPRPASARARRRRSTSPTADRSAGSSPYGTKVTPAGQRLERRALRRLAGQGERAHRAAVEAALGGDHRRAAGAPGELERRLVGLGAGVGRRTPGRRARSGRAAARPARSDGSLATRFEVWPRVATCRPTPPRPPPGARGRAR